jgi:SIR2-like domain
VMVYDSSEQVLAQDSIVSLRTQLRGKGVIPFVGAGMSVAFGYPGWADFLENEASVDDKKEIRSLLALGGYEEAADLLDKSVPFFRDRVKSIFGAPPQRRSEACPVEHLPTLFPSGPIFTTNFDRVLERVYDQHGKPLASGRLPIRHVLEFREHVLIKLHGDFADDESRVLTLEEYTNQYGDLDNELCPSNLFLPQALNQLFSTESVLFLGCGLRNDRYLRLLRRIESRTTHYAIMPYDRDKQRADCLEACNIRPIFYDTVDRHRFIEEILLFLSGATTPHLQSTLAITVYPGTDLLQAVKTRFEHPTIGVPAFEQTAFCSALRFRNNNGSASLRIVFQGGSLFLEASPTLRIPFTQHQRSLVDLRKPADDVYEYDYLPTTSDPLGIAIEPGDPCRIVLKDEKRSVSVRATINLIT